MNTYTSLFTGGGGACLGFKKAGFEIPFLALTKIHRGFTSNTVDKHLRRTKNGK